MRRTNGDGSIYQLPDGRWVAALSLGAGRRKTWKRKSRQAVQRELAKARRQIEDGLSLDDESVVAFLRRWLAGKTGIDTKEYQRYVEVYAKPIHRVKLAALTPAHLQAMYAGMTQGPKTIANFRRMLNQALEQAEQWDLIRKNPGKFVKGPKVPKYDVTTYDEAQVGRLVKALDGDRLEALYLLAMATGLREGELLSLKWDDLQDGGLVVRHSLKRPKGGGYLVKENKTASSRRMLPLAGPMLAALKQHRLRQAEERLAAYEWSDEGFIFTNTVGKPLNPSNLIRREWKPLLERAGLPYIRFYDLRHTAATLLLSRGWSPKLVAEMLGHSTIVVTMDRYSHVTPGMRAQTANELATMLFATSVATQEGEIADK